MAVIIIFGTDPSADRNKLKSFSCSSLVTKKYGDIATCRRAGLPRDNIMIQLLLAHLSRRLEGELIVYPCSGVRRCRRRCRHRRQPFSNMNISEASRPIAIKFYLKHHWDGG